MHKLFKYIKVIPNKHYFTYFFSDDDSAQSKVLLFVHTKPNKSIQYVHFFVGGNAAKIDDIAIDDLRFVDCNPKAAPPAINCTFDSGTCGWLQDKYDQFDWTLNNGSTASRNTGPTNDHTFGDGSGRLL